MCEAVLSLSLMRPQSSVASIESLYGMAPDYILRDASGQCTGPYGKLFLRDYSKTFLVPFVPFGPAFYDILG